MKILGFGTYDKRVHPRVAVLFAGLAERGHDISELNRPLDINTDGRVEAFRNPRAAARFTRRIVSRWIALGWASREFRGKNRPDALLVGYLGHFDVIFARLLYPRTKLILDHLIFASETAADRRLSSPLNSWLLRALDWMALTAANLIVVDTHDHLLALPRRKQKRTAVVPVGAPAAWFAARECSGNGHSEKCEEEGSASTAPTSMSSPTLIFFGLFTPLQGTPTIFRALRILDARGVDLGVTVVGTGQDYAECRRLAAELGSHVCITWIGWIEPEKLPIVVASHDICLGIFSAEQKAMRVVPNKVYQGMAAGCALITSDTRAQREVLQNKALYVEPEDPEGLADMIQSFLDRPRELAQVREEAARYADEHFQPEMVVRDLNEMLL